MAMSPIEILSDMQKTLDIIYCDSPEDGELRRTYNAMIGILGEAKERIEKECGWISTSIELPPEDTNVMIWEGKIYYLSSGYGECFNEITI